MNAGRCPKGHLLDPAWNQCPYCVAETDAAADPSRITNIGRYQILELLGRGGMGEVWKALDPVLQRTVAIKCLSPNLAELDEVRERFLREARAQTAINHPNIVRTIDFFIADNRAYIVMDFIAGPRLDELMAKGPLDIPYAIRIARGVLSGLEAAHRHGVVHRDIKPANILLDGAGDPHISDFGIALVPRNPRLTQTGMMGTPEFMSPEQIRSNSVDHRSDIYSFGAVLYEMLTGARIFAGDSEFAILQAHVSTPPRPLRELNPAIPLALEEIVCHTVARHNNLRSATAGQACAKAAVACAPT